MSVENLSENGQPSRRKCGKAKSGRRFPEWQGELMSVSRSIQTFCKFLCEYCLLTRRKKLNSNTGKSPSNQCPNYERFCSKENRDLPRESPKYIHKSKPQLSFCLFSFPCICRSTFNSNNPYNIMPSYIKKIQLFSISSLPSCAFGRVYRTQMFLHVWHNAVTEDTSELLSFLNQ